MNHQLENPKTAAVAAALGFAAVALGAFGAHGLADLLRTNDTAEIWQTAVQYHLFHTLAILAVALALPKARLPAGLWTLGVLVFSGSLYLLAVTNLRWLGAITPFGGVLLLAGWLALLVRCLRSPSGSARQ